MKRFGARWRTSLAVLALTLLGWHVSASVAPASQAPTPAAIHLDGAVAFWQRPVCDSLLDCQPPTALSAVIAVGLDFEPPNEPGPHLVVDRTIKNQNFQVQLMLIWVNPQSGDSQSAPYVVTQIALSETQQGVIAMCSRYDAVGDLKFLPVGSCSGKANSVMYGVSTMSPAANH